MLKVWEEASVYLEDFLTGLQAMFKYGWVCKENLELIDEFATGPRISAKCHEWENVEHFTHLEKMARNKGLLYKFPKEAVFADAPSDFKFTLTGVPQGSSRDKTAQIGHDSVLNNEEKKLFIIRMLTTYEYLV